MNPEESVSEQTQPRTNIVRVVAASMAGTTVEWYDFFLYGVAAALVFPHVFFPTGNATAATLASLGTFAVGFLARPVGGLVFGHYGDRIGRKKLLVLSLLMMGLSTFAIGLLPSYATVGVHQHCRRCEWRPCAPVWLQEVWSYRFGKGPPARCTVDLGDF